MTPTLIPDTVAVLTSTDRCDRCGARAATASSSPAATTCSSVATTRAATRRHNRLSPEPWRVRWPMPWACYQEERRDDRGADRPDIHQARLRVVPDLQTGAHRRRHRLPGAG